MFLDALKGLHDCALNFKKPVTACKIFAGSCGHKVGPHHVPKKYACRTNDDFHIIFQYNYQLSTGSTPKT